MSFLHSSRWILLMNRSSLFQIAVVVRSLWDGSILPLQRFWEASRRFEKGTFWSWIVVVENESVWVVSHCWDKRGRCVEIYDAIFFIICVFLSCRLMYCHLVENLKRRGWVKLYDMMFELTSKIREQARYKYIFFFKKKGGFFRCRRWWKGKKK